jgi:hypothetical protein
MVRTPRTSWNELVGTGVRSIRSERMPDDGIADDPEKHVEAAPKGAASTSVDPAATYSPTGLPQQYHRRRRA